MARATLDKIYKDIKNPASFSGVNRLHRQANNYDDTITRAQVEDYLQSQDSYTLLKPARRRYPVRKIFASAVGEYHQIDLFETQQFAVDNDDVRYILGLMDVKSRYVFLRGLKDKKGETVAEALKEIYAEHTPCAIMTSDAGSEFISKAFQNVLKIYNIQHHITRNAVKACLIERFFLNLRIKIGRLQTHKQSWRFIDDLQAMAQSYNTAPHRSLGGKTPEEVYNEQPKRDEEWLPEKKPKKPKLKVGTYVRLNVTRTPFTKASNYKWTERLYVIKGVNANHKLPLYQLATLDKDQQTLIGNFYPSEVTPVTEPDVWPIERVIRRTKTKSLVKYLNYEGSYWIDNRDLEDV